MLYLMCAGVGGEYLVCAGVCVWGGDGGEGYGPLVRRSANPKVR